jgi:glutamate dehydrogenase
MNKGQKIDSRKEDKNVCIDCTTRLEELLTGDNFSESELELLKRPKRVVSFTVPVKMDSGDVKTFNGYRVQYNDALGPAKGGLRFHPEVNLEEVKNLSFLMALKCSLAGIPFGGGKGGVEVDPKTLSKAELERLSRSLMRELHPFIGERVDIPAPDVNTNEQIMAWMVDEYAKIKGQFIPGVLTGKPLNLGGSQGRTEATALGGAFVLRRYFEHTGKKLEGSTVAIQGFGNVGSYMAKFLHEWGAKVVAVSDAENGLYNEEGLDIPWLLENTERGTLPKDVKAQTIKNSELLELDVDVLIPAAISHQITMENISNIKANLIIEMANDPITPDADRVLLKKNIPVIPDILANAGGVIVSYFEWIQNTSNEYWFVEKVNEQLEMRIVAALEGILKECEKYDMCDMRKAGYSIALKRIVDAEKMRGRLS